MKAELIKSEILSDSTKAESNRIQRSVDSRRCYPRPRTNSPFPPLRNRMKSKPPNLIKQCDSFNSSINNGINGIIIEHKPGTNASLRPNFNIINYSDSNYRLFDGAPNSEYKLCQMSAPGSAESQSFLINSCCRNRRNLNEYQKIQMMSNQETLHKIHLDENKKTYISWKSIAINQNDLNKEEKEQLGFSPPYVNQTNNDKIKEGKQDSCGIKIKPNSSHMFYEQISKNLNNYLPDSFSKNMNWSKTQATEKREMSQRKSFDASSMIIPQSGAYNRMPTIAQNKSNYMNYSQFKKNGQSALLYGGDCKFRVNGNFIFNQNSCFKENVKFLNNSKQKTEPENIKKDISKIIMEGRKVLHASNLKVNNERRKPRSHQRCNCETGKIRRKFINCSHKIPFCLDVRTNHDDSTENSGYINIDCCSIQDNLPNKNKIQESKIQKNSCSNVKYLIVKVHSKDEVYPCLAVEKVINTHMELTTEYREFNELLNLNHDYVGVNEETLVSKYIKTKEIYETLFLEEQKILLWPIVESRFKFTNEEMVHVDLYRMVACYLLKNSKPEIFEFPSKSVKDPNISHVGVNQTKTHQEKREDSKSQGKPYLWRRFFKSLSCYDADALQGKAELYISSGTLDREEVKQDDTNGERMADIPNPRESLLIPQTNLAPIFSNGGLLILPSPFDVFDHKHDLSISIASSFYKTAKCGILNDLTQDDVADAAVTVNSILDSSSPPEKTE